MKDNLGPGQRIQWRSLTFQLLAVVVFPLIALLLVITFGSSTLHQNAMRALVGERDERAARMAATAIEEGVQARTNAVRELSGQLSYASRDKAQEVLSNAGYLHPFFDAGLAIFGSDGALIATQGNPTTWVDQKTTVTAGLNTLKKNPPSESWISNPVIQPESQKALLLVMAPTRNGQAIVAGAFYTDSIVEKIFANIFPPGQESSVAVIAPNGNILYRLGFNSQAERVEQHAGVAEALAGKKGATYMDVLGSEHVVAYTPVQPFGWALLIEEPWEQVDSPLLRTTHLAPLVMVPVLLLALLGLFFGIRQIVQPLQALATESSRLGWGDYNAIENPVGGVSEIRQLQTELIHMARKVRAAQQSLHSYIGAITSGQEEERRRLARELHDDTIQSLIAFKQRVQLAEMDWEGHPVALALSDLGNAAEQTIENLRRMISALRPIYLEDLGLVAAMNMLVTDSNQKPDLQVDFYRSGKERRLPAPVELALYRIVQEAMSNITRHSEATQASVRIAYKPEGVEIHVQDNGIGFAVPKSPAEFAPGGHFGLLGMVERAELIGGEIQIDSASGQGTRIVIIVPDSPEKDRHKPARK
jgi:signal transduction histidine kinase